MKKIFKWLSALICTGLCVLCIVSSFICKDDNTSTPTRDVELSKQNVDYKNFLESFRNYDFKIANNISKFSGEKQLKDFDLSFLDLVSEKVIEDEINEYVSFEFTCNKDLNKIIVSATISNKDEVLIENLVGYVFQNESGETDAIITLDDGSNILLSDLASRYIDNCGWLSKLIKGVVSTVAAVVIVAVLPISIPAVVAVTATAAISYGAINLAEKCQAESNYKHNITIQEPTGYINGQNYYSNWKFGIVGMDNTGIGKGTLDKNGCGVIATYNVLRGINKSKKLADVIYEFDYNSGSLASGLFGSDPTHYSTYFSKNNISCKKYESYSSLQKAIRNMSSNQMILVCAWNGNSIFDGAHYVAASYTKGVSRPITVYNLYISSKSTYTFSTFDQNVIGGNLITAYIIG